MPLSQYVCMIERGKNGGVHEEKKLSCMYSYTCTYVQYGVLRAQTRRTE